MKQLDGYLFKKIPEEMPDELVEVLVFHKNIWKRGYWLTNTGGEQLWCIEGVTGPVGIIGEPTHWLHQPPKPPSVLLYKEKCPCSCHTHKDVFHGVPCCNNGYIDL